MGRAEGQLMKARSGAAMAEMSPAVRRGEADTVFGVVAAHASTAAQAPALTGDGRSWTYGQLVTDGEAIAARLVTMAGADARVAVVADNSALTCLVYLACARAGILVTLVNSRFRRAELATVFARLEPRLVIADAAHDADVDGALADAGQTSMRAPLDDVAQWTGGARYAGPLPSPDSTLEITWTSGTTSAPKGAMLTHAIALYRARWEGKLFGLGRGDTAAVITPLFHQSGIRNTVLASWIAGGHAVILPRFDAATFWADMARHKVTYLCMVETILLMLERNAPSEAERANTVTRVLAAGDPNVVRRCEQRFGFRVVQVWGMTETGVSTAVPCDVPMDEVNPLRDWANGAPLAGWALGDESRVRLVREGRIVDGEGEQGEIQFASPMLFAGYFRDEAATEASFDGEWFKTGDLGMYGPGGVLYFLDRIKDVIRRGGENIASKQVEDVLSLHPGVAKAAVIPVPDPLFMQEVMAVVVPHGAVSAEELWSWCDERLARYKVPRYFRIAEALPVNGSGRVQKQMLVKDALTQDSGLLDRRAGKGAAA
jgi:acyl-CoA synthetase (AMP-forming)/AMP-acid ligase II